LAKVGKNCATSGAVHVTADMTDPPHTHTHTHPRAHPPTHESAQNISCPPWGENVNEPHKNNMSVGCLTPAS
jgi:hypothetical protein